jgi:hypothetical protein
MESGFPSSIETEGLDEGAQEMGVRVLWGFREAHMFNSLTTLVPKLARRSILGGLTCLGMAVIIAACEAGRSPSTPTAANTTGQAVHLSHSAMLGSTLDYNKAVDEKGYIDGWFNGETVQLYYTKVFFCPEPPDSGADSHCEIGADPEIAPRPGPIPTIYAIAAVGGIQPDLSTLACPPWSVCLNHPAMIDVSRVRGPGFENSPALPHSHILAEHHAGWFNTVNIRVSNLGVWNQIAAAKNLDKVRELQAAGIGISQDTPTNIYFFIASWR